MAGTCGEVLMCVCVYVPCVYVCVCFYMNVCEKSRKIYHRVSVGSV